MKTSPNPYSTAVRVAVVQLDDVLDLADAQQSSLRAEPAHPEDVPVEWHQRVVRVGGVVLVPDRKFLSGVRTVVARCS